MDDGDPGQLLARRLRALREEHWPGRKVNQSHLAHALGGEGRRPASVPLIASWESRTNPKVPPAFRIQDIATFYASPRSFDGRVGRLLSLDEMTEQEREARESLVEELSRLRNEVIHTSGASRFRPAIAGVQETTRSLGTDPYRFKDGYAITIVCAQLPPEMLQRMPYTDPLDPDFIEFYRYSDLDALLELFGHVRAANPLSHVQFRAADQLHRDDYTGHLVSLGGVDWNEATSSVLDRLQIPVRQVNEWDKEAGAYFEVTAEDGVKVAHHPRLERSARQDVLREDVALFARAVNPFNRLTSVTICNGMYGRGTYGTVRALTDERFRDRNWGYINDHHANSEAFCILIRVTVENGVTLTPDWTLPETRLFEWCRPR